MERSARRLQIGRVVVLTSQLIRDNAPLFLALAFITTALPSLFLRYEEYLLAEDEVSALYLIAIAAYVISAYVLTAAITKAVILLRTRVIPPSQLDLKRLRATSIPLPQSRSSTRLFGYLP